MSACYRQGPRVRLRVRVRVRFRVPWNIQDNRHLVCYFPLGIADLGDSDLQLNITPAVAVMCLRALLILQRRSIK